MGSVQEHYDGLLAEIYSWMCGGFDSACKRNADFFERAGISCRGTAVDLGSGCGFQSIPLARMGFQVIAIDTDEKLLSELKSHAENLKINVIHDDLMNFQKHCKSEIALAVCMTDTILHLESQETVKTLCVEVFKSLENGGKFIVSFRDLSQELQGLSRFIPVKSDEKRILTCFLEYTAEKVFVHDLLYERNEAGLWNFKKSSYVKLRLSPEIILAYIKESGFAKVSTDNLNGMITIIAEK